MLSSDHKPSELLKSNRTGPWLQVRFPTYQSATPMPLAHACIKRLGRRTQSVLDFQQVRQYRGTQSHSTESTMTSNNCFGCQKESVIIRQQTSIHKVNNIIDKEHKKRLKSACPSAGRLFSKNFTYASLSVTVTSACQRASGAARLFFRKSTISNDENTAKQKNYTLHHRFKQHDQQRRTTQASTYQSFLQK